MTRFLNIGILLLLSGCNPQHFFVKQATGGVALYLDLPDATKVQFASSADSFQVHPANRTSSGLWAITTRTDREFDYFYIVDGRAYIPDCMYRETDDFGSANCIYVP